MKCPKCGFQSFNYLSNCKKCGKDLSGLRDKYGLGDPVLPFEGSASAPEGAAPELAQDLSAASDFAPEQEAPAALADTAADSFGDMDSVGDFDEMIDLDPELAATLDPDADWAPGRLSVDEFGQDSEDVTETPDSDEAEPLSDALFAAPLLDDADAEAEADVLAGPAGAVVGVDDAASWEDVPEALIDADAAMDDAGDPMDDAGDLMDDAGDLMDDAGDLMDDAGDLMDDAGGPMDDIDDVDLDEWLLDGEEPSWRRPSLLDSEETVPEDDEPSLKPFATGVEFFPEQVELPFESAERVAPVRRASVLARMMAGVFDAGLLAASLAVFVLAGEYLRQGGGTFRWPQPQDLAAQAGPYFLVFFGLAFGYFTLFHYLSGQTPGKMAAKLLVVDVHGGPLQLSQAFLRSVGGLFCLIPAGLGFCSVLLNSQRRGWNDLLAGSMVVPAGLAPELDAEETSDGEDQDED